MLVGCIVSVDDSILMFIFVLSFASVLCFGNFEMNCILIISISILHHYLSKITQ